jgi:predicted HicB family RNase H-like nuclease
VAGPDVTDEGKRQKQKENEGKEESCPNRLRSFQAEALKDGSGECEECCQCCLDGAHKYGRQSFVKTTLEIPEPLFRKAKATAARQGHTLKQLIQEALSEKIARIDGTSRRQKPWMAMAGGLKHLHSENRRIERVIEAEFENIEPEDRQ